MNYPHPFIPELASYKAVSVFRTAPSAMHFKGKPIYINIISKSMGRSQSSCNYCTTTIHSPNFTFSVAIYSSIELNSFAQESRNPVYTRAHTRTDGRTHARTHAHTITSGSNIRYRVIILGSPKL